MSAPTPSKIEQFKLLWKNLGVDKVGWLAYYKKQYPPVRQAIKKIMSMPDLQLPPPLLQLRNDIVNEHMAFRQVYEVEEQFKDYGACMDALEILPKLLNQFFAQLRMYKSAGLGDAGKKINVEHADLNAENIVIPTNPAVLRSPQKPARPDTEELQVPRKRKALEPPHQRAESDDESDSDEIRFSPHPNKPPVRKLPREAITMDLDDKDLIAAKIKETTLLLTPSVPPIEKLKILFKFSSQFPKCVEIQDFCRLSRTPCIDATIRDTTDKLKPELPLREKLGILFALGNQFPKCDEIQVFCVKMQKDLGVEASMQRYDRLMSHPDDSVPGPGPKPLQHRDTEEREKLINDPEKVKALVDAFKEFKITEAEVKAIRAFTADYFYWINPATANQQTHTSRRKLDKDGNPVDWMDKANKLDVSTKEDRAKKKTLMDEGALHSGVLILALRKLPAAPTPQITYRGLRITQKEFEEDYIIGNLIPITVLQSSSKYETKAIHFARQQDDDNPIRVVMAIVIADARDINELSIIPGEGELLIMPGGKLRVDEITEDASRAPRGGKWFNVKATQILQRSKK
jgi:hypothetical protein